MASRQRTEKGALERLAERIRTADRGWFFAAIAQDVAERYGIEVDDAFRVLRRAARSNRVRIHDLAARVVASRETPSEFGVVGLPHLLRH